jgi:hypothetical protein
MINIVIAKQNENICEKVSTVHAYVSDRLEIRINTYDSRKERMYTANVINKK